MNFLQNGKRRSRSSIFNICTSCTLKRWYFSVYLYTGIIVRPPFSTQSLSLSVFSDIALRVLCRHAGLNFPQRLLFLSIRTTLTVFVIYTKWLSFLLSFWSSSFRNLSFQLILTDFLKQSIIINRSVLNVCGYLPDSQLYVNVLYSIVDMEFCTFLFEELCDCGMMRKCENLLQLQRVW